MSLPISGLHASQRVAIQQVVAAAVDEAAGEFSLLTDDERSERLRTAAYRVKSIQRGWPSDDRLLEGALRLYLAAGQAWLEALAGKAAR
jgi:hypothetical protein